MARRGADKLSDDELAQAVATPTEHRIFFVVEALRRGWDIAHIHAICGIDPWYLNRINDMVQVRRASAACVWRDIDADAMRLLKQYGTSDAEIAALTGSDERFVRAYRKGSGRGSQHEDGRYLRGRVLERHGVPLQDLREHLPHEPGSPRSAWPPMRPRRRISLGR